MDYKIIKASSTENLVTKVQYYIRNGWKPLGGLTMSVSSSDYDLKYHESFDFIDGKTMYDFTFCQAMIKE